MFVTQTETRVSFVATNIFRDKHVFVETKVLKKSRCVWQLNVDGCIWIGKVEREGGGGEYERSRQEKEARVGWVIRQIQIGVVV